LFDCKDARRHGRYQKPQTQQKQKGEEEAKGAKRGSTERNSNVQKRTEYKGRFDRGQSFAADFFSFLLRGQGRVKKPKKARCVITTAGCA